MKQNNKTKVGVITLHDNINFGNRLQAYALQQVLQNLGADAEEIVPTTKKTEKIWENYSSRFSASMRKREEAFKAFGEKFVKQRIFRFKKPKELKQLNDEYDLFIAGSDQIWNPFFGREFPSMLLEFADFDKSASYAASIAIPMLPIWISWRYKRAFKKIKHLSLRENSGKKIVDRLLRKNVAEVHIDPTLLLSKEEWLKFCENERKPQKPYILTYFLGNKGTHKEQVEKIANLRGGDLEIVDLHDAKGGDTIVASPQQFVALFSDATLVCTDSFHGCVFSTLFEKPFVSFKRKDVLNMSSRTKTFFSKLGIENRDYEKLPKEKLFNMDYRAVAKNLQFEREKGMKYLQMILDERRNENA